MNHIQIATVYNFDEHRWLVPNDDQAAVMHLQSTTTSKTKTKKTRERVGKSYTPTGVRRIRLEDLVATSYYLPDVNVLRNICERSYCEQCKRSVEQHVIPSMFMCDGTYPTNVGLLFPENAQGRQFECHRGYLCPQCYGNRADWFCKACTSTSPKDFIDVFGFNIREPGDAIHERSESIMQWPSVHPDIICLKDANLAYDARQCARTQAKEDALQRRRIFNTIDAQRSNDACSKFITITRNLNFSGGQQSAILEMMHELHNDSLLVAGLMPGRLLLPKTIETVAKASDGKLHLENDISIHTVTLDTTALQQGHTSCEVHASNVADVIQNILLDNRYPPGSLFLQNKDTAGREYVELADPTETSSARRDLYGHEPFDNERWKSCLQTCTDFLLGIAIHSDGVRAGKETHHPWSISIVNFPAEYREMVKFAMSENLKIRVPRNSTLHEHLDSDQKIAKRSLKSKIAFTALASLEELARNGPVTFWVRNADNSLQAVKFDIRLLYFQQDIEEWLDCNGCSVKLCGDCEGTATAFKSGQPGSKYRPFISTKVDEYCGSAPLRAPLSYLTEQSRLMLVERMECKTTAEDQAKKANVAYKVPNHLYQLRTLLPWSLGGPHGVNSCDLLHGFKTGIVEMMNKAKDSYVNAYHGRTESVKTLEDIRHELDSRLSQMGDWYGHPSFKTFFWGRGDTGGLKGAENVALFRLSIYTLAGCKLMIANDTKRKFFLKVMWDLAMLLGQIETEQFYLESELLRLDEHIKLLMKYFGKIMEDLGDNVQGHGFDCLKTHLMGGVVKFIRRYGSLKGTDTEGGERSMKTMKQASEKKKGDKAILQFMVAHECDVASSAVVAPVTPMTTIKLPMMKKNRAIVGTDSDQWLRLCDDLFEGKYGPSLPEDTQEDMFLFLQKEYPEQLQTIKFDNACAALSSDDIVAYNILRPGHCVQTIKEQIFQILIPLIVPGLASADDPRYSIAVMFTHVDVRRKCYPELPCPWLKRGALVMLPVDAIHKRVHVVPLFGNAYGDSNGQYLLNTSAEAVYPPAAKDRIVFMKCRRTHGCDGLLARPNKGGSVEATCPNCSEADFI